MVAIALLLVPVFAHGRGGGGHGGAGHAGHSGHAIGHPAAVGMSRLTAPPHLPFADAGAFRAPFTRGVAPLGATSFERQAPFHQTHPFGHGSHCFFSRHHHRVFAFFFVPLFAFGYAYPSWYEYPYVEEPEYAEPDVSEFEPYYTSWTWSAEADAYLSRYFVTPDSWMVVMVYPDQPGLAYFYDPLGRRFIGVLDASGDFRHWYGDEIGWGEPEPFPDEPPPPLQ